MCDTTIQLAELAAMSNKYGADPAYVLAGGGNTSYKSADRLWVKGSSTTKSSGYHQAGGFCGAGAGKAG